MLCHFCIHLDISRFLHHLQVLSGLLTGHSQHPHNAQHPSSRKLPGQLIEEAGERFFFHGTSPQHILAILHEGFSEKLASLKGASAFTRKSEAHGLTTKAKLIFSFLQDCISRNLAPHSSGLYIGCCLKCPLFEFIGQDPGLISHVSDLSSSRYVRSR